MTESQPTTEVEVEEAHTSRFLPVSYTNKLQNQEKSAELKIAFLRHFRRTGNVSQSCRNAKITSQCAYQWRQKDPAFAKDWQTASDEAVERLEEEARRRAVTGYLEPVFFQGMQVGKVRKYSDTLLVALLRARHPDFKEKIEVTGKVQHDPLQERIERASMIDLDKLSPLQREALDEVANQLLQGGSIDVGPPVQPSDD